MMTTDYIDPSEVSEEQTDEQSPPADDEATDPEQDLSDAEELQRKLAVADNEVKRWKGRYEKAKEATQEPKPSLTMEELEWKLTNKDRIALVEETYNKILDEGFEGEKVGRKSALAIAEKIVLKNDNTSVKRGRQDDMSGSSVTNRVSEPETELNEYERRFGITAKRKKELQKKYPEILK
jgi:hypothetical protein